MNGGKLLPTGKSKGAFFPRTHDYSDSLLPRKRWSFFKNRSSSRETDERRNEVFSEREKYLLTSAISGLVGAILLTIGMLVSSTCVTNLADASLQNCPEGMPGVVLGLVCLLIAFISLLLGLLHEAPGAPDQNP